MVTRIWISSDECFIRLLSITAMLFTALLVQLQLVLHLPCAHGDDLRSYVQGLGVLPRKSSQLQKLSPHNSRDATNQATSSSRTEAHDRYSSVARAFVSADTLRASMSAAALSTQTDVRASPSVSAPAQTGGERRLYALIADAQRFQSRQHSAIEYSQHEQEAFSYCIRYVACSP